MTSATAIALHFVVLPDQAAAPDRIQVLPPSPFTGSDGRGPYSVPDMAALIQASMARPIIIDANHSTDRAAPNGQEAPAYGRITALEAAADGSLWARVAWNARGEASVGGKEYYGISPVFEHLKDGRVLRLLRVALTNDPNLTLQSLHMKGHTMSLADQLRQALGLPDSAEDAAITATVAALHAAQTSITTALGLPAGADRAAILTALQARQPVDAGAYIARAEHDKLQAEVTALKAAALAAESTSLVDAAIAEHRAAPAEREHLIRQCTAMGAESFRAAMAARPKFPVGPAGALAPPAGGTAPDDAVALGRRAAVYVAAQSAKGIKITTTEAVLYCQAHPEAGQ